MQCALLAQLNVQKEQIIVQVYGWNKLCPGNQAFVETARNTTAKSLELVSRYFKLLVRVKCRCRCRCRCRCIYLSCESAHPRSMDLGSMVDEKLEVKYMGGDTDKTRRKLKRKVLFIEQVRKGVKMMQVNFTASHFFNISTH